MTSISLPISITICLILGSVLATPINAHISFHHETIYKRTTLYSLTFQPQKEGTHIILCHPIGKSLTTANNAAIQYNFGVVEGQKALASMKCPTGHTEDYCKGFASARLK